MKYLVILIVIVGAAALFAWSQNEASPVGEDASQTTATDEAASMDEMETMQNMDDSEAESADTATESDDTSGLDVEAEGDAEVTIDAEPVGEEVVVNLDGFNYGYSEETITVSEGDTVTVNLTSSDGFHDWVVDEFDAATERIQEGETTSVTFVADAAGEYEFYCSVGNHRAQGMVGTLIVE